MRWVQLAELKGTAGAVEFAYAGHVVKYDGESSITVDGEKHQVSTADQPGPDYSLLSNNPALIQELYICSFEDS